MKGKKLEVPLDFRRIGLPVQVARGKSLAREMQKQTEKTQRALTRTFNMTHG